MTVLPPLGHLQPFLVHISEERTADIDVLVLASTAEEADAMLSDWEFDDFDFDSTGVERTARPIEPNLLPGLTDRPNTVHPEAVVGGDYFDLKQVVEEYLNSDAHQQRLLAAREARNGQLPLLP